MASRDSTPPQGAAPSAGVAAGRPPFCVGGARVESAARNIGIDAARGFALIGMMAVHIFPLYNESDGNPTLAWSLFAGRSAALFALLAGVSIALMTGGTRGIGSAPGQRVAAAAMLTVRSALIVVIGLVLGHFTGDNIDVILAYYGVMFVLAIPLLGLSVRTLWALGLSIAVVSPFLMQGLRDHLPQPPDEGPTFSQLAHPFQLATNLLLTGVYPAIPWMAYICCGLAIGRMLKPTRTFALQLFASGTTLAVVAWVSSSLLLYRLGGLEHIRESSDMARWEIRDVVVWGPDPTLPTSTWWWLAIRAPHSSTPFDILHTLGAAIATLGAMLLLRHYVPRLLSPLMAAGTMTLTLYSAHVFVVSTGIGQEVPHVMFLLNVTAATAFAFWWRPRFGQGPLEKGVATPAKRTREYVLTTYGKHANDDDDNGKSRDD